MIPASRNQIWEANVLGQVDGAITQCLGGERKEEALWEGTMGNLAQGYSQLCPFQAVSLRQPFPRNETSVLWSVTAWKLLWQQQEGCHLKDIIALTLSFLFCIV